MNKQVKACLADLENRIDPEVEQQLLDEWVDFSEGRFRGDLFSPKRGKVAQPGVAWPQISVNAALQDKDMMVLQQYGTCSDQLASGGGEVMNVRSNYGTSIIPLLFGVELFVMDEETNTLPTSLPLHDIEAIKRIVDRGVPDIHQKYMAKVLDVGRTYAEIASTYPKIGQYVHIYHPDLQGPMDICEVIWGASMFYALYDQPELVEALIEIVTKTYIRCMNAWIEIVPFYKRGNAHWGLFHKGNIMLRDDSAMNLSLEMFNRFIRPYDQRLLDEFGGGAIHFCGRGDHYAPALAEMDNLYAVNMSQPEYNDLETIWRNLVDNGIKIIGLERWAGEKTIARGRDLKGQVHCRTN